MAERDHEAAVAKKTRGRRSAIVTALVRLYRGFKWTLRGLLLAAALMLLGNVVFHSQRGVPYRALDPTATPCIADDGWDVLSKSSDKQVANDEWSAIDNQGSDWRVKFSCAIQRHAIPGYRAEDGTSRRLTYDFAFLEFDEDGKPYALRQLCAKDEDCDDEGFGPVKNVAAAQLSAILRRIDLNPEVPKYVMVFIHGWRHDAGIGDANVSEFRQYAAHAARFIEDRWTDPSKPKPQVMAIFIGWRGARTDETWLARQFGPFGAKIGNFSAILTLFDRKPVSEAIAASVLSGLRAIEQRLHISTVLPSGAPAPTENKMIVFGHSLGGNMLATALQEDLVKKVGMHKPTSYMLPVLGDLVVLINPASEATKWMSFQRAVWSRIATSADERRPGDEYAASHAFFPQGQRPIVISVTAARDWPPGGRRELDCFSASRIAVAQEAENKANANEGFNYDWATYDMFPAFKGDLRPFADTLRRMALGVDPHDACDQQPVSRFRSIIGAPLVGLSALLRILPFMQTDPEQTHTIGNLDPPRAPRGALKDDYATGHPFGTTHELRGLDLTSSAVKRFTNAPIEGELPREIPANYNQVIEAGAACPVATSWLISARTEMQRQDPKNDNHGIRWTSTLSTPNHPALNFRHGFDMAGIAPITRANDPFWNIRAFDSALARHDGYMLSSFICAMNQLVLDDITAVNTPAIDSTSTPQAGAVAAPGAAGGP